MPHWPLSCTRLAPARPSRLGRNSTSPGGRPRCVPPCPSLSCVLAAFDFGLLLSATAVSCASACACFCACARPRPRSRGRGALRAQRGRLDERPGAWQQPRRPIRLAPGQTWAGASVHPGGHADLGAAVGGGRGAGRRSSWPRTDSSHSGPSLPWATSRRYPRCARGLKRHELSEWLE